MLLDETNCIEAINSLTLKDWKPLFGLIPEVENTREFSERRGGEKLENGSSSMPYSEPAEVITKFLSIVHAIPIIIAFDWPSWDEGREMASDKIFDFDTVDPVEKCKLISAIIRNDRFCEGALASAFESGLILKVLKSIEKQVLLSEIT